jgi:hypothetical protein
MAFYVVVYISMCDITEEVEKADVDFLELLERFKNDESFIDFSVFRTIVEDKLFEYIICRSGEVILVVKFDGTDGSYIDHVDYKRIDDEHTFLMLECLVFELQENARMSKELYGDPSEKIFSLTLDVGILKTVIFFILAFFITYFAGIIIARNFF